MTKIIYAYTRKQALEDGFQIDVSETAREAGIIFPVFMMQSIYDCFVRVRNDLTGQDEEGRLWDILWMLRVAIQRSKDSSPARLPFILYVRNDHYRPRPVELVAECGSMDINDPRPAITIMSPDED